MSNEPRIHSPHAGRDAPSQRSERFKPSSGPWAQDGVRIQALQRRLEQLQAAMGETPTSPPTVGTAIAAQSHSAGKSEAAKPVGKAFMSRLGLICLLPVLGLAYWWTTSHHGPANAPSAASQPQAPASVAPAPGRSPATAAVEPALRERVESWRKAWAARDITAYLAHYSTNFEAANGISRADWENNRRRALARPVSIVLNLHSLQLSPLGPDRWVVRFRQDYAAGSLVEKDLDKSLEWQREGDQWLIVSEQVHTGAQSSKRP